MTTSETVAAALDGLSQGTTNEAGAVLQPGGNLFLAVDVPMLTSIRGKALEVPVATEESREEMKAATIRDSFTSSDEMLTAIGAGLLSYMFSRYVRLTLELMKYIPRV
mgnify:FL=1